MKISSFLLLSFFFSFTSKAQLGCTDPQANNYNTNAMTNDGSCMYDETNSSLNLVSNLVDDLGEASGIAFFDEQIWVINDAGNGDQVHRLNPSDGNILQSVTIANADNIDWEDLAEDETHLYIGDFGNNYGNRTNLRIYKINKSDLVNNFVNAELIEFSFSDQTDFNSNPNYNDFDCESFFYFNDKLHLFSKNWVTEKTRHYILPNTDGTHVAMLHETFDVNGLVTSADISDEGVVTLIGYYGVPPNNGFLFMWLLFDYQDSHFFSGNKRRIEVGTALESGQIEGIAFQNNDNGYIVGEEFSIFPPRLNDFSIDTWIDNMTNNNITTLQEKINVFPNPVNDFVHISCESCEEATVFLYNNLGQLILEKDWKKAHQKIDLNMRGENFISGWYLLQIRFEDAFFNYPLIKK